MHNSKVSIIIPVYNAAPYLKECLDSLLAQTYEDLEIICVDDGSTDASWNVLLNCQCKDRRIRLLRQENLSAGAARNYGFEHATGDYAMFLDADDVFAPDMVERMASRAEECNADIVICKEKGLDDETKMVHPIFAPQLDVASLPDGDCFSVSDLPERIFQITDTWVWDKLYRTEFIREKQIHFQSIRAINDALFCCLAYAEADRISFVDEELVWHRTNVKTSIEYNRARYWHCAYEMLDGLERELTARGLFDITKQSFINLAADRVVHYVGTITDSRYFCEAFQYYQDKVKEQYRFLTYPEAYYHNEYVYQKLRDLEEGNATEYLCGIIQEKNEERIRRFRDIWTLEEMVRARDEMIKMRTEMILARDKEILKRNETIQARGDWIEVLTEKVRAKSWWFPEEEYPAGTRYVLYGYGRVGKDYARQLVRSNHSELVAIIDEKWEELSTDEVTVASVDRLQELDYDYVIISVRDAEIAKEIRNLLREHGVSENQIIGDENV